MIKLKQIEVHCTTLIMCITVYLKLAADAYARMQSGNVPTSAVIGPTTMPSAPISVMRTESKKLGFAFE